MDNIPFVIWNESFSVGDKLMDDQHRFLLSIINDLFNAMQKNMAEQGVHQIVEKMVKYTKIHFSSEEAMLREVRYPGYTTQVMEHIKFTGQVLAFQDQIVYKKRGLNIEILNFLKEWWINHINGLDMLYMAYLKDKDLLNT